MFSPRPCVLEQDAVWVEPRPAKQGYTLQRLHTTVSRFCAGAAHTRLAKLLLVVRCVVALVGHTRPTAKHVEIEQSSVPTARPLFAGDACVASEWLDVPPPIGRPIDAAPDELD